MASHPILLALLGVALSLVCVFGVGILFGSIGVLRDYIDKLERDNDI